MLLSHHQYAGQNHDIKIGNRLLLNNIHPPVYVLKHNDSETGLCLRPQVKPTLLGPISKASPYLWRQSPVSESLCYKT
jgi:hypothetical protein